MTKRRSLSRLMRTRIFDNAQSTCCLCHFKINAEMGERWIIEHKKPLWLGGADDESNMGPAHERCAIQKTVGEAPIKAKSDRVRANYLGIKRTGRPMPGSRRSRFKRKVNGTVELRD